MVFTPPELKPYQEAARDFIIEHPHCGIYLRMGGGKSLTTLTALSQIRPSGHILVVAPINIARSTWIDEIEKWGFPLRTKSLIVNENDVQLTRAKRLEAYEQVFSDKPTMYFINRELIPDLVENMPVMRQNGKKVIQWPFPTVILDESQSFKSPSSTRFKALKRVRPAILRLVELTGTPTPHSLLDLWSQIYLLDQGLALGKTMTEFRARYFTPTKMVNNRPVAWEPNPGAKEEIYRRIAHLVMSTENSSIPLPDVSVDEIPVKLPKKVKAAYDAFAREQVLELAHPDPNNPGRLIITADNAGILHNKLIQYASGTIYTGDDHTKDFAEIHDEKLQMTDYLLNNNGGTPTIVAYRYQSDRTRLMKYLTKKGHNVQLFDGSRDMIRRWNAGSIPVMLLQPASAGHGLNLQDGGHTLIWFTLPDSLEHYQQTNSRLIRMGQQNQVEISILLAQQTKDARMPLMLKRKSDTQDDLLDAVQVDLYEYLEDIEDILGDLDISPL